MLRKLSAKTTYTIYGQIEGVVADAMIGEGKCTRIEREMVPSSHCFNDRGQPARFAVVVPDHLVPEFERRIAQLRA